jgi:hypothetical protein
VQCIVVHSQCSLVTVECSVEQCSILAKEGVEFSRTRYHTSIIGLPGNDRGAFCLSRVGKGAEVRRGQGSMLGMCTCTRSPSPDNTIEYRIKNGIRCRVEEEVDVQCSR